MFFVRNPGTAFSFCAGELKLDLFASSLCDVVRVVQHDTKAENPASSLLKAPK